MEEITAILKAVEGGGQIATVICCYFIWKASDRLSRIEKALDRFIKEVTNK